MIYETGPDSIDTYLSLVRGDAIDREALRGPLGRPWHHEYASLWCGFGGRALVYHRAFGVVPELLWQELERAARQSWLTDQFIGCAGIAPILSEVGVANPARARTIASLLLTRTSSHLARAIAQHQTGKSVFVGFAHGIAGVLVAFEQCCALIGHDGAAVRRPAIDLLLSVAVEVEGVPRWPTLSRDGEASMYHGVCHGAPGICFAAMMGFRYSLAPDYEPLINETLKSGGLRGGLPGFCCGTLGRVEVLIEAHRLTGDEGALQTAKALFADVSDRDFQLERWSDGKGGLRFTQARLAAPIDIDLPGFPPQLEALAASD